MIVVVVLWLASIVVVVNSEGSSNTDGFKRKNEKVLISFFLCLCGKENKTAQTNIWGR
ncbi:hypothetical protein D3C80_2202220 [compost metagenome]